jgi:hypothetical protein
LNERTKIDLAVLMGPVARILWGEPDDESRKELRWGRGGSRSVSLGKNTWYDHEAKEGGGVLDLIKRETGAMGTPLHLDGCRRTGFMKRHRGPSEP